MAVIAGALMVLGAGIFASSLVMLLKLSRQEDWLWSQQDEIRELRERADAQTARLDDCENRLDQPSQKLDEIMSEMRKLRESVRGMAPMPRMDNLQMPLRDKPREQPPRASAEHLDLLLEPVIELSTGSTAHYRAMVDLSDDSGHVVRHSELMRKAEQGGMRPALDAHLVKQVAPVLRRLRQRNPGLRAFVPIGLSTLKSAEEAGRIATSLERDSDVAGGIVFEFEHRDLGSLDQLGIGNLARLGRLGATMALSNVQTDGLDLAALRQLGVRFLGLPPHALDVGFGPASGLSDFVQYARAMQFQIIASDIVTPQQAAAASRLARFGHGSFFAPPRKVRADAGASQVAARSVSAA